MKGSKGDRERQERLVEQGAGNAVADLRAGFGEAAADGIDRAADAVERGADALEAGAERVGAAVSGIDLGGASAAEVGENFRQVTQPRMEAAVERGRQVAEATGMPVAAEPVVEQGDGFHWMNRARKEAEETTYWRERCLRAESVNPLSPSELEEERDHWLGRAA